MAPRGAAFHLEGANTLDLMNGESASSAQVGRVMGFDVGSKRIGIAITDPLGYTVQPLMTLVRKSAKADMKSIGRLIRRYEVVEAVVGKPVHMSGQESPRSAASEEFAAELRSGAGIPVHLVDERLTSHEAHQILDEAGHARGPERRRIVDQVAAVLILETFLAEREWAKHKD